MCRRNVPTELSTLMTSVIRDAVSALLDQHSDYTQQGLETYLAKHYPEVAENLRAPIVVAATAGARQAALMHVIWEKNVDSPDPSKRQFAAGAASSLSFWALGTLPVHRSGNVYRASYQTMTAVVPASVPPSSSQLGMDLSTRLAAVTGSPGVRDLTAQESMAQMSVVPESVAQELVAQESVAQESVVQESMAQEAGTQIGSQTAGRTLAMHDIAFPVALMPQDGEFDALMLLHGVSSQLASQELFAALPAAVTSIQPVTQGVNAEVGVQPPYVQDRPTLGSNDSELGRSPVIELRAASDVESDGDEVRRAVSTITVSAASHVRVSAQAIVKEAAGGHQSGNKDQCQTLTAMTKPPVGPQDTSVMSKEMTSGCQSENRDQRQVVASMAQSAAVAQDARTTVKKTAGGQQSGNKGQRQVVAVTAQPPAGVQGVSTVVEETGGGRRQPGDKTRRQLAMATTQAPMRTQDTRAAAKVTAHAASAVSPGRSLRVRSSPVANKSIITDGLRILITSTRKTFVVFKISCYAVGSDFVDS